MDDKEDVRSALIQTLGCHCLPLGFPAGWLLQAFSMACFFWTSVREKPGKRKRNIRSYSFICSFARRTKWIQNQQHVRASPLVQKMA